MNAKIKRKRVQAYWSPRAKLWNIHVWVARRDGAANAGCDIRPRHKVAAAILFDAEISENYRGVYVSGWVHTHDDGTPILGGKNLPTDALDIRFSSVSCDEVGGGRVWLTRDNTALLDIAL